MNKIVITKRNQSQLSEQVGMSLSIGIETMIVDALREAFPIPMLRSERTVGADGMINYAFELSNEDADLLRQTLIAFHTKSSGYLTIN